MNKSPYDNLQVVTPHYVDVEIEEVPEEPVKPAVKPAGKSVPLSSHNYSNTSISNRKCVTTHVITFEETLLVPDTMPDMAEILIAEGQLTLNDNKSYTTGESVGGNVTFYTIYQPENHSHLPVEVIKSQIPFKTKDCFHGLDSSTYHVTATLQNLDAKRYNERKFIAKGEVHFAVTEISKLELSTFDNAELVCCNESISAIDLCLEREEVTEISQDINVNSDAPAPVKLLQESIEIVENHRQVTSGKLVVNAVIVTRILYVGDADGDMQLCNKTIKTDFTQFVPIPDNIDTDLVTINFINDNLNLTIASNRQFLLQGQVKTQVYGYCRQNISMITDAYHKTHDISFDCDNLPLSDAKGTVSGEISSREVISLDDNSQKPSKLLTGYCCNSNIEANTEGSRVIIDGSIQVKILALDEDSVPFVIECVVPVRGAMEMPANCNDCNTELSYYIRDFWFDEINSRQIEVNISACMNVWLCGDSQFVTLKNVALYEVDEKERCSISLCVTSPQDTLWQIAKRCKSSVDDIAALNNIDPSASIPPGTKLLVMK